MSRIFPVSLITSVEDAEIDLTRLIYMVYQDLELQISRADAKAQLIVSINTILIAAIASFGLDGSLTSNIDLLKAVTLAAFVLMFVALIVSVGYALRTSFPAFVSSNAPKDRKHNLFYFGHNATLSPDDYTQAFMDLSVQEVKETTFYQIHAKSVIAKFKFENARKSMQTLMVAIILLAIGQCLQLFV